MSRGQEFRQDLLEIRFPMMKIKTDITDDDHDESGIIQSRINGEDSEEYCQTPKSRECMIAKVLSCPPAPRKPKPSCKRKLHYEMVSREETESLFRMFEANINGATTKKRCLV
ncbi:cyclin-dependent protein kinase inhibitor SMR1 [Abeliophyllum distichum]|uniref:Cyclin-dependent protein kinase inhibitor SMR1 n=1 Tax=Abeliophyllum distichum TaxID=126358 RepID=A0ABD1V9I2_9LAMI